MRTGEPGGPVPWLPPPFCISDTPAYRHFHLSISTSYRHSLPCVTYCPFSASNHPGFRCVQDAEQLAYERAEGQNNVRRKKLMKRTDLESSRAHTRADVGPTDDDPGCRPGEGHRAYGSHGAADSRAEGHADHRTRCPQRQGAAALRGEGAAGRAQRGDRADRRHRLRPQQRVRRADPHAHAGEAGGRRIEVQPLPHHRAVQSHARGPAHRPQPSREQRRGHHGTGHGLPRQHRRAPRERDAAGRDPAPERLQHRGLRQVPRDRAVGSLRVRPVRPLADAVRASTSSTASSAARPTSGRRASSTAQCASRRRTRRAITSPPT